MRTALALVAVLAMLVAARAKPLECVLWPKACHAPAAAPANPEPPLPPPAPIQAPPAVVAPPPSPIAAPPPRPAKAAPPRRIKSKFAKPKRKAVDSGGPDLPYSCAKVREHAAGKSQAQLDALEALGRVLGYPPLSPKQRRQAAACLASKR